MEPSENCFPITTNHLPSSFPILLNPRPPSLEGQRSRLRVRLVALRSHTTRLTVLLSLRRWKECDCGVRLISGACLRPAESVDVCVVLLQRQQCISMGLMWKLSILLIQTTMLHRRLMPFGWLVCLSESVYVCVTNVCSCTSARRKLLWSSRSW